MATTPAPIAGLVFTDPRLMPFTQWAALLSDQLAEYNLPNPVSEGLWQEWAVQLFQVPALVELGLSDPRAFTDWRDWASSLSQVLW